MMATDVKDYYKTVGVAKDAAQDEIKRAYRKLARKYHPDLNPGDKTAEQKFKELNEAYEVLSDPKKRAEYDQFGSAAFGAGAAPGLRVSGPMTSGRTLIMEASVISSPIFSVQA